MIFRILKIPTVHLCHWFFLWNTCTFYYLKVLDHCARVLIANTHWLLTNKTEILDCISCVVVILLHLASRALILTTLQQAHSVKSTSWQKIKVKWFKQESTYNTQTGQQTDTTINVFYLPYFAVDNECSSHYKIWQGTRVPVQFCYQKLWLLYKSEVYIQQGQPVQKVRLEM